jgi:hypothetical protein
MDRANALYHRRFGSPDQTLFEGQHLQSPVNPLQQLVRAQQKLWVGRASELLFPMAKVS